MKITNEGAVLKSLHGEFQMQRWEVEAAPGDVVIRVELTGVCGSDVHIWKGEWAGLECPLLMGHEIVGTIVSPVDGLTDQRGRPLRQGDRVVMATAYYANCGQCYACQQLAAPWACQTRGRYATGSAEERINVYGGGFSRYVVLSDPDVSTLLAIDAPAEIAVLHEPLSVAIAAAMESPRIFGSQVVIQGTGALGLLSIAVAKAAGASRIIAIGAPRDRVSLAAQLGADHVIDIDEVHDPTERATLVKTWTTGGWGADIVMDWTGYAPAFAEGLTYLRPGGTLMEGGAVAAGSVAQVDPSLIWSHDLKIVAMRGTGAGDFERAADFLEGNSALLGPLVTHHFPLEEVARAFDALSGSFEYEDRTVVKAVIDMR